MRRSRSNVVAAILACLMIAPLAHPQFGKLKSLVQDKPGAHSDPASPTPENQPKAPPGEAKATFARGQKKTPNIPREGIPTPEGNIASIQGGRPQQVSIKVSQIDARQFEAVRAYSPCNKLKDFQILSAMQVKVTVDLTDYRSSGVCSLYFISGGETVFTASVPIRGK